MPPYTGSFVGVLGKVGISLRVAKCGNNIVCVSLGGRRRVAGRDSVGA